MTSTIEPFAAVDSARLAAQAAGVRATVLLAGEPSWAHPLARQWAESQVGEGLWLGTETPPDLPACVPGQARHYLGRELAWLVVDTHGGFDVEAFAATAGALRAGGVLLWLVPARGAWGEFPDPDNRRIAQYPAEASAVDRRFWVRLAQVVARHPALTWVEPTGVHVGVAPPPLASLSEIVAFPARTADQAKAIEALRHVVHGHRRRPLVLSADRGRGKSAALGIAAATLLREGRQSVVLSAPRPAAVQTVFEHAAVQLPEAERVGNRLRWQGAELLYLPPDALEAERPEAELVLIDEAAAIPVPTLERLLAHYSRIAFATTVHGYEGTGRGFAVRFRASLERLTPNWRELKLNTPIRWAEGDPLEALINDMLLLDAEPADLGAVSCPARVRRVARDELLADERRLRQLFGLLVIAHYQTSPQDLRHLLDAPDVEVFCLEEDGQIVAVALVVHEGELPVDLAAAVERGERRLRGHLIPQSLLYHAGLRSAGGLCGWRVLRVAVHPQRQRRGLGSALLAAVADAARDARADYLGASFGGGEELYAFWRRAGYRPARVGLHRDAASGSHSLIVLQGLSAAGDALSAEAETGLRERLPRLLAEPLNDLDAGLVLALLGGRPAGVPLPWGEDMQRELEAFAAGRHGYELCVTALDRAVRLVLATPQWQPCLSTHQWRLLVRKILQQLPWPHLVREGGFAGRAEAEAELRYACAQLATALVNKKD